ncbi:MAG: hypothetical protein IMZ41_03730 [Actinobacteria bacterium]|nr:hypothetical protein [Actinomycetota bacterium]
MALQLSATSAGLSQLKVIAKVQIGHSRKLDALLEMVEEFEVLTKRVMIIERKLLPFK